MGVSRGVADMAECEGPLGETTAIEFVVKALAADAEGIDARIQLISGPSAFADGLVHGSVSDGRPTDDGDLASGRFSVDFGAGLQIVGFVLRQRAGRDVTWVFHVTGGSGCLNATRGDLSFTERMHGVLRLSTESINACGHPPPPVSSFPGLDLPALMRLTTPDGGAR